MKRCLRLGAGLLALLAACAFALSVVPSWRSGLVAWIKGEPFIEGRPLSYWIDSLRVGDEGRRAHAATVLGEFGTDAPGVVPGLVTALKDENPIVRRNATAALARYGANPDAV